MTLRSTNGFATDLAIWTITALVLIFTSPSHADPIGSVPYQSFAGNVNFQMTGASLRTAPNTSDPCSVLGASAVTQARLTGLPTGAVIRKAYLYWAGSGDESNIDIEVRFENQTIRIGDPGLSDSRLFTDRFVFTGNNHDFFSGFADITDLNLISGNGVYDFSGLSVVSGSHYCTNSTAMAGWSLIVIYEHSSEPLRVINLYHGFQHFQNSNIELTPSNFQIPTNGCSTPGDCKWGVLTWEGDPNLPNASSPTPEVLSVNGISITNGLVNPSGNQFNSTIDLLGTMPTPPGTAIHGVDIDIYPLPSSLSEASSATTRYESGQDLVLLSAEIFSVRNEDVADLSISKTHSGNFTVGQQGAYTITITNNGPIHHTGQVTVTDTLPTGLTYVSASDPGANWSCNAAGQVVTCTTHQGPINSGNSFSDITLTVDVDATAAPSVTNAATVEGALFDNNTGNNSASDPTSVFNPGPASGTKQLYFYMANAPAPDTNTIQRVRVASNQNTRSNIGAGNSAIFVLTPALQAPLVLEDSPINIDFWLRRIPNGSGPRDVTVTLDDNGGPIGTIGTQTQTGILNANGMQLIRFSFTPVPAAPVTLAAGTTLRLTLTNEASSSGSIRTRSVRNGTRSQIALDTTTVINVDSVAAYSDVAYPGGVPLSNVAPDTTIRIRAVVSDPFGHDDITSATLTLVDPNSNPLFTNASMTVIATPLSTPPSSDGTKIFEYSVTIPQTGLNGTWTAIVTANEGTEGTISDQEMGTFVVSTTNIVMTKTVSTLSNPVEGDTNPHAIPGAIMQYEIVVTNSGIGPADEDSIIITDLLSDDLRLVLNSNDQPVTFEDGLIPSGLTFDPSSVGDATAPFNDVALSNDSDTLPRPFLSFGALSHDSEGIDNLPDKINFIRINPKGTFAGSTGGAHPSFTLRFQMKLQ